MSTAASPQTPARRDLAEEPDPASPAVATTGGPATFHSDSARLTRLVGGVVLPLRPAVPSFPGSKS
jgi:hypothetical protein